MLRMLRMPRMLRSGGSEGYRSGDAAVPPRPGFNAGS